MSEYDCIVCSVCSKAMQAIQLEEHDRIHSLESSLKKYRAALEKIAKGLSYERHSGMDSQNVSATRDHLRMWATAALTENPELLEGKRE